SHAHFAVSHAVAAASDSGGHRYLRAHDLCKPGSRLSYARGEQLRARFDRQRLLASSPGFFARAGRRADALEARPARSHPPPSRCAWFAVAAACKRPLEQPVDPEGICKPGAGLLARGTAAFGARVRLRAAGLPGRHPGRHRLSALPTLARRFADRSYLRPARSVDRTFRPADLSTIVAC